jgi:hypothetical protein
MCSLLIAYVCWTLCILVAVRPRYPPNRPRRINAPVLMFAYEDTPCSPNKFESGEIQALSIHFDRVKEHIATPGTSDGVLGLCALVIPGHTDHCQSTRRR